MFYCRAKLQSLVTVNTVIILSVSLSSTLMIQHYSCLETADQCIVYHCSLSCIKEVVNFKPQTLTEAQLRGEEILLYILEQKIGTYLLQGDNRKSCDEMVTFLMTLNYLKFWSMCWHMCDENIFRVMLRMMPLYSYSDICCTPVTSYVGFINAVILSVFNV